jgi:hypothetical protein
MRRLADWLYRLLAPDRATLRGLPVRVAVDSSETTAGLLARLEAVVELVAINQPQRFRRMCEDMAGVSVEPLRTHRAEFRRGSRICVLDTFFVDTFPAELVASSLVHEGMHARIQAAGITGLESPDEERACRRAELRFGLAIPGGEAVVERARAALALDDHDVAPLWKPIA